MHDKICDLLFSNVQLNMIFLVRFFEVTQSVLNCTYKQKTVKDLSSIFSAGLLVQLRMSAPSI